MKINFEIRQDKTYLMCNDKETGMRWITKNLKIDDELIDCIFYHCKEQLIKELKEIKVPNTDRGNDPYYSPPPPPPMMW